MARVVNVVVLSRGIAEWNGLLNGFKRNDPASLSVVHVGEVYHDFTQIFMQREKRSESVIARRVTGQY